MITEININICIPMSGGSGKGGTFFFPPSIHWGSVLSTGIMNPQLLVAFLFNFFLFIK